MCRQSTPTHATHLLESEDAAALARSRDYYRDKAYREARRVAELQKALTVLEARVSAVFATTTSQGV